MVIRNELTSRLFSKVTPGAGANRRQRDGEIGKEAKALGNARDIADVPTMIRMEKS